MRSLWQVTMGALILTRSPLVVTGGERPPVEAVAVVSSLSGEAAVAMAPEMKKAPLRLFDWLSPGSVVELGAEARMTLAYSDGRRWELGEKTKAEIGPNGPKAISGIVRPLEAVPPIPRIAPIAKADEPGARSAAIRLRADRIRNLYPRAGTAALPESAVLSFSPVDGARYKVELEEENGRTILDVETESEVVGIPPGVLKPGRRYFWRVKTVERRGGLLRGEGEFATLGAEDIARRSAFKASVEKKGDAESLALLAEVDRRLGLLAEAREEFKAALALQPTSDALRRALEGVEKRLSEKGDDSQRSEGPEP